MSDAPEPDTGKFFLLMTALDMPFFLGGTYMYWITNNFMWFLGGAAISMAIAYSMVAWWKRKHGAE